MLIAVARCIGLKEKERRERKRGKGTSLFHVFPSLLAKNGKTKKKKRGHLFLSLQRLGEEGGKREKRKDFRNAHRRGKDRQKRSAPIDPKALTKESRRGGGRKDRSSNSFGRVGIYDMQGKEREKRKRGGLNYIDSLTKKK